MIIISDKPDVYEISCDEPQPFKPDVAVKITYNASGENVIVCQHYAGMGKCDAKLMLDTWCRYNHAKKP